MHNGVIIILHVLLLHNCVLNSINLVSVSVPGKNNPDSSPNLILFSPSDLVRSGSPAVLTCSFMVSPGQFMDSVKWYLNSSEIYRIVPSLTKDRYDCM